MSCWVLTKQEVVFVVTAFFLWEIEKNVFIAFFPLGYGKN